MKHLIIMSLCFFTSALIAEGGGHTEDEFRSVEFVRAYDGDTITVNIPGVHPLLGKMISIRVLGVDAPEIRTRDMCEKNKAALARELVIRVLRDADRIDLKNIGRDKYFRIVAKVVADGVDVAQVLLERRLVVPYDGGTKQKVDWCLIDGK